MQNSWQAQHFGAPRSADFAADTALGEPRSAQFAAGTALCEPRSVDFVAGAALCVPRSADNFVAGAALGEPRSADFVAGTALGEPRSADFVAGAALGDQGRAPGPDKWSAAAAMSILAGFYKRGSRRFLSRCLTHKECSCCMSCLLVQYRRRFCLVDLWQP